MEELNLRDLEPRNESPLERKTDDIPSGKKEKKVVKFWDKVFNRKKIEKEDKVAVIFLRNNRTAVPLEVKTKNGFFNINGKSYHEDRDCIYSLGKERVPLAIIPEWSLVPVGTRDQEDKFMLEKFAEFQDHVMKAIRHAELVKMGGEDKKPLNPKVMIMIGLVVIVVYAVMSNYS